MSGPHAWLAERTPRPPTRLRDALTVFTGRGGESSAVADVLGGAALAALREAQEIGDDRAAAWPLLTADALLTYALEAAAEQGSAQLQATADRLTGQLARLVEAEP